MKHYPNGRSPLNEHLGCFGNFDMEDLICQKLCAVSIRCAIERDQNVRMELLEDLSDTDTLVIKIQ
jgi:hypothetical protein